MQIEARPGDPKRGEGRRKFSPIFRIHQRISEEGRGGKEREELLVVVVESAFPPFRLHIRVTLEIFVDFLLLHNVRDEIPSSSSSLIPLLQAFKWVCRR